MSDGRKQAHSEYNCLFNNNKQICRCSYKTVTYSLIIYMILLYCKSEGFSERLFSTPRSSTAIEFRKRNTDVERRALCMDALAARKGMRL